MQMGSVTTPFGRRPMSLALVRQQQAVGEAKIGGKVADKWKVFRDASAAFEKLGIQSNSLAVLNALLSFYPEGELRQGAQMIVFPSNVQLSLRAHSMAGATVRRHIAILVEAGLIIRRDSANGKRYARKGEGGEIESAFGFDLSPLLVRADELAILAQAVAAERTAFRRAKENLTICRRNVRKLITAAIEEGGEGDWHAAEEVYLAIVGRIPRSPSLADLTEILDDLELLQAEVLNRLEIHEETEIESTNAAFNEQHIQNSNPDSITEFERSSEKEPRKKQAGHAEPPVTGLKAFPLAMILKACPTIADYGPAGGVGGWRDLMGAAVVVRSMLGVSPSAYQEACDAMGPENAAAAMACILERAGFINSAGGYLRDLTARAARGEFSLGPMLMALLRSRGGGTVRAAC